MSEDEKFQEFYAQEARVYEQTRYETRYGRVFRKLHHHVLRDALSATNPDASCLEVACGTGHTTRVLVEHFNSLTACDLTPEMMSKNQFGSDEKKVTYMQANAFSLPFPDNSYEVLVSTRFFHLFNWEDQQRLFEEFNRVLAPGGTLIVDFDNIISRWFYVIPHVLYNLIRYQRLAPFSIYNLP
ncbi:MAG: ubiquinone/menaquinone biosynthesis C-methylase UbiE, partial [Pseudohongiellaceae bacterium]